MDWPSFKAAQQRAVRRQASPKPLFLWKQVALRRLAMRSARLAKAASLRFATQHAWQSF